MRKKPSWGWALLTLIGSAAIAGAACDDGVDPYPPSLFPAGLPRDGGTDPTPPPIDLDGAAYPDTGLGDGGSSAIGLVIVPDGPTVDVTGPGSTVQFSATASNDPKTPLSPSWAVDAPAIGSIDANGKFTATGAAGGLAHVFADLGDKHGSTTITVRLHLTENPGGLSQATQNALKAGGATDGGVGDGGIGGDAGDAGDGGDGGLTGPDGAFAWLYPYDKTVFPRGLLPPTLQWAGTPPDAVYLKITSTALAYEGFYGASNPGRLAIPGALWNTITATAGASDPVKVEVTKINGSVVTGPITETWTIAQGSLKGVVYYNSYDSPLASGDAGVPGDNDMGAVMKIKPGALLPEVLIGGAQKGSCTVCHTVSANGSTMAAAAGHKYDAFYSLDGGSTSAPLAEAPDNAYSFGALTPDGKLFLSCSAEQLDGGNADGGAPNIDDFGPNLVSMTHGQTTKLIDTSDGGIVSASILDGGVTNAMMPSFSPDGKHLVFSHQEVGQGHTLSVLDFDESTHTFSNLREIVNDQDDYLGWPSFLPDGNVFVYQVGSRDDFATWNGASGELLYVDVPTKTSAHLYAAGGKASTVPHDPYLPNADDFYLNFEPTLLPVAVGGYYWMVFTSRRHYGNVITIDDQDEDVRKKLWVAAIDIDPSQDKDPSHPAFYLEGQELGAGNMRGFWALDPCKQNGLTCESGAECCTGFCRQVNGDAGTTFTCVAPPAGCAQEYETCTQSSDCCEEKAGYRCINGHCARPTPK